MPQYSTSVKTKPFDKAYNKSTRSLSLARANESQLQTPAGVARQKGAMFPRWLCTKCNHHRYGVAVVVPKNVQICDCTSEKHGKGYPERYLLNLPQYATKHFPFYTEDITPQFKHHHPTLNNTPPPEQLMKHTYEEPDKPENHTD